MQKKLIALAIAGLASSAAFAQANVTVYGKVDVGYEHASGRGGTKTSGINSGLHDGSRLGFKGEEALGNGMKAVFKLEYQLQPDISAGVGAVEGSNDTRQAYVGLEGSFGSVLVGRVYTAGGDLAGKFDSMDAGNSFSGLQNFTFLGSTINGSARSNSVRYTSNTMMGGLTFSGQYGFATDNALGTSDTAAYGSAALPKQERFLSFGVDYDKGPLALAYAHQRQDDMNGARNFDQRENAFAGSYDLGMVKLMGLYMTVQQDAGAADTADYAIWSLGGVVPVSKAGLVRVQYAKFNNKLGVFQSNDANAWSLGYDHSLSKRTMLYVGYNRTSQKSLTAGNPFGAIVTPAGNGQRGFGSIAGAANASTTGYGFGVIHNF